VSDFGRQSDPVEKPQKHAALQKPKNDFDRLGESIETLHEAVVEVAAAMESLAGMVDRNNRLLERAVAADEAMRALSDQLFPPQGPEPDDPEPPADPDALNWHVQNGSFFIGFGPEARPASDGETKILKDRYPKALDGGKRKQR